MSKEGQGGLLSKVVRFVKSPTTNWSDLDRVDENTVDPSHQAMKALVERRRRNDFVRQREFEMLRRERRRKTSGGVHEGYPSMFPASGLPTDVGERAQTLRKIDEIEEQMSRAWLPAGESAAVYAPAGADGQVPASASTASAEAAAALAPGFVDALAPTASADDTLQPLNFESDSDPQALAADAVVSAAFNRADAPTVPMGLHTRSSATTLPMGLSTRAAAPTQVMTGVLGEGSESVWTVPAGASAAMRAARAPLPPYPEVVVDPEMEEAAIRFANGDAEGAAKGLRALIGEGGERRQDQEIWLALFDLYRASNQQAPFDLAAVDFAACFGRSPPQWHVSVLSGMAGAPAPVATVAGTMLVDWTCPAVLSVVSVAAVRATVQRNAAPWRIDWRYLKTIEPEALPKLVELLDQWATLTGRFKFLGADVVEGVLEHLAPTEDRSVDPLWWRARLALLRVMGQMDRFDMVALDYCVTYEVSPPAWEAPHVAYSLMNTEGETLPPAETGFAESVPSLGFDRSTTPPPLDPDAPTLHNGQLKAVLKGEILGDINQLLLALGDLEERSDAIEFNGRQLRRIDFGAAGALLNWATEQQEAQRSVTFVQMNRLVAAFFGVIGITACARVLTRSD